MPFNQYGYQEIGYLVISGTGYKRLPNWLRECTLRVTQPGSTSRHRYRSGAGLLNPGWWRVTNDTREVWASFFLPQDRARVIELLADLPKRATDETARIDPAAFTAALQAVN